LLPFLSKNRRLIKPGAQVRKLSVFFFNLKLEAESNFQNVVLLLLFCNLGDGQGSKEQFYIL
jgi:hypothetical protein